MATVHIQPGKISFNQHSLFQANEYEVNAFLKTAYKNIELTYPKFHKMDALSKLGFLAAEYLLQKTNEPIEDKEELAIVFSNSHSTIHVDKAFSESIKNVASPALFVYTLPNILIGELSIRHKIFGESIFLIDRAVPYNTLDQVTRNLMGKSELKYALVGRVDVIDSKNYCATILLVKKGKGAASICIFDQQNLKQILKH